MTTFQQEDRDKWIHQFLGVIFKIWKAKGLTLRVDPKHARGAGSVSTIPFQDVDPENKTRLLMLPGKKAGKTAIISRHTSPRIRWPKLEK